MSYEAHLRRLAVHGPQPTGDAPNWRGDDFPALDTKAHALARLAALVAIGGSPASYAELTDEAVSHGADPSECVAVLDSIVEIVGVPRIVEAAPKLALALGYDIEVALEEPNLG